MKKSIIILICISGVFYSNDMCAESEKKVSGKQEHSFTNVFVGKIRSGMNLNDLLVQATTKSGVIFCREKLRNNKEKIKDRSVLSNKSVEELLSALESEGFVCTKSDKSILITDAELSEVQNNPLDIKLEGFTFKGNHEGFLGELGKQVKSHPKVVRTSGAMRPVIYDINIKEKITVRDLLLHLASSYRIAWRVSIEKEVSVGFLEGPDGIKTKVKRSNWTFSCYSRK